MPEAIEAIASADRDEGALFYDDAFLAKIYDHSPDISRRPGHPAEQFYLERALEFGGPVLDVGVGSGRYALPIVKAGLEVAGVDISQPMLDKLLVKIGAEPDEVRARLSLFRQDIRAMQLDRKFATAILPSNMLLLLPTSADQLQTLGCINTQLEDDGVLVLDVYSPDLDVLARGTESARGAPRISRFSIPDTQEVFVCHREVERDLHRQHIHVKLRHELAEQPEDGPRHDSTLTFRYLFPFELAYLVTLAGFRIERVYGDYDRRARSAYDDTQIIVARKERAFDPRVLKSLQALNPGLAAPAHG
jgi:SAM-dependent methyltransferase